MWMWKRQLSLWGQKFDAQMERFLFRHAFLGFLMMFLGMPLLTLAAVCACTSAVVFPMALAFGWM